VRRPSLTPLLLATVLVTSATAANRASALTWPDVLERIEHDLASSDPAVRAVAAEKLDALGPQRATPLVLKALGDTDTGVRVAAAGTAARTHTAGATTIVIPWFAEHDARLRVAACDVVRALPDPRAVAPLARALSDADGAVRIGAIEALGVQGSPDAVPPLLGKLDDPSPAVRAELARALAHIGDRRAVVPLIGKVEDSVPEVREAVARALGDLGDPRAAAAIVLQLRDASPEVRVVALTALGKVHGSDTVDAISPLATDRNTTVRHAALATLGMLANGGSAEALHVLVTRLGLDEDASAELEASPVREALVLAGDPAVAPLRALLHGGGAAAAVTSASWVLGALRASAASPDILAAVRRGTLPAAYALHALSTAGTPDDLAVVLEFVGSENPRVRVLALAAARALLDPVHPDGRAVEPLLALARTPRLPSSELVKVIELLGRTGAARAAAPLQGFVHSRDVTIELAAIDALSALGPTSAPATDPARAQATSPAGAATDTDEALLARIRDPLPEVRLHAADALAASGGPHARDALLLMLHTGTELDRAAALTALGGVLVRNPSDGAWPELSGTLEVVVGGERDAVLLALARAAPVHPYVERMLASPDADDRRTVVTACAGRADATPLLRRALADVDPSVRAQAAWSLGSDGVEPLGDLDRVAHDVAPESQDAAVDAAGAIARIAGRSRSSAATASLCALIRDPRVLVRANALVGLALGGARCGDGAAERELLTDPANSVRAGAARAVGTTPRGPADDAALVRCATTDHSAEVASLCQQPPAKLSGREHDTLAYVEGVVDADPRARVAYVVEFGDGLVRAGTADRRGAFFDPRAPDGLLRLHHPATRQP